ncbi:MAG: SCO family protein [Bacteroidetes bacterium]|nr:SCO family protein [Bacteroidota bacterium]
MVGACQQSDKLPVYGNKQAVTSNSGSGVSVDSVDYTIPNFSMTDQDGKNISNKTIEGKIHIADFFFTSCPSICPKMMAEMLKVYEKYKSNPEIVILSYTIDPARDTVGKLKSYGAKLGGIETSKWHLLTGDKDSIYQLAGSYLVSAAEDPDAPGGHIHSGSFILVDKQKRIRGYYDGTNPESVAKLMDEIDQLLKEK